MSKLKISTFIPFLSTRYMYCNIQVMIIDYVRFKFLYDYRAVPYCPN